MSETFERGETQNLRSREPVIQTNSPAHRQEDRKHRKHSDNRDASNDRKFAAMEIPPVPAGRLNQTGGHGVRYGYAPGDFVAFLQRIQMLVFVNRFGGGLERKLRRGRVGQHEQQPEFGADYLKR